MAHFALTRSGGWFTGYVPAASEIQDLDQKTFKAINGDEGGTWAPTAQIIIGGSGVRVDDEFYLYSSGLAGYALSLSAGLLSIEAPFTASGNDTFTGTVSFSAAANFSGTNNFSNGLYVSAGGALVTGAHVVTGNGSYSGTLSVAGNASLQASNTLGTGIADVQTLHGTVGIEDTLSMPIGSTAQFQGTTIIEGNLELSGAGQIIPRVTYAADADTTYGPAATDLLLLQDITANRTYTLSDGTVAGQRFEIDGVPSAYTATIHYTGSSVAVDINFDNTTTGYYRHAELVWTGTYWRLLKNSVTN